MNKSLTYLDVLVEDQRRCVKKLTTLSMKEKNFLESRRMMDVLLVIEAKKNLVNRLNNLDHERRHIQLILTDLLENPGDSQEKLQASQSKARLKKLKTAVRRLNDINRENATVIKTLIPTFPQPC